MRILVVNAGSSSLKLRLLDGDAVIERADLEPAGDVAAVLRTWPLPDAVGHRIVHGGTDYRQAVRLDARVAQRLRDLTSLAPLHQPKSVAALDAVTASLPRVPAVACFDTAFHATIPDAAATYAVPGEWRTRYGVRRYGFHGLSHAYVARRVVELTAMSANSAVVSCHLGAGASLCAIRDGRSVDTTMGFTPLEGLVMATRSGSVDPGLLLWLQEQERLAPEQIATALEHRSGLLGLAGTADMREVLRRMDSGDSAARLAFDVYIHRLVVGIAGMAAAAGGLSALVFTGGVGEHAPRVRAAAVQRLGWLGATLDSVVNETADADAIVTGPQASVQCVVVTAREDLQIARETRAVLTG